MSSRYEDLDFEIIRTKNTDDKTTSKSEHSETIVVSADKTTPVHEQQTVHEKPHSDNSSKKNSSILRIFLGDYIANDKFRPMIPYIIFVTILAILYIYNGFAMNAKHRQVAQLTEQVKELRAKSMAFNALKMQSIQRSSILNKCNEFGLELEESVTPPKIVEK